MQEQPGPWVDFLSTRGVRWAHLGPTFGQSWGRAIPRVSAVEIGCLLVVLVVGLRSGWGRFGVGPGRVVAGSGVGVGSIWVPGSFRGLS